MNRDHAETPPIEIETAAAPVASIIWLHGLGADGHDFVPLVPQLALAMPVRFVFPHAPYRAVTINGGYVMRAWYDLAASARGVIQNDAHVAESVERVRALMAREAARGVDTHRIVLAGFSQGGLIALHAGLGHPQPLAGVLALSPAVVDPQALVAALHPANARLPVFMAHGRDDTVVPFAAVDQAQRRLRERELRVEWHSYDMGHTLCAEEVQDTAHWLAGVLSAP